MHRAPGIGVGRNVGFDFWLVLVDLGKQSLEARWKETASTDINGKGVGKLGLSLDRL